MGLSGQQNQVVKYNGMRTTAAILGVPIPILFGQGRIAGKLIWYGDFVTTKAKNAHGGKGLSKGDSQYVYSASVIAALCQGQINYLLNVWDSKSRFVLLSASESYTISGGSPTYTTANAAIFGNDQGVAVQQTYSVGPFTDYGSPGAVTLTGTQGVPMTKVSGSPTTGQYSVNPATGVYSFASADAGKQVVISYSYYRYQLTDQEITIVPFSGPYTVLVDNSTEYQSDLGVVYYSSGTAFTEISSGTPTVGQYKHSGATYTFAAADSGQAIIINYTYKDPNTDTNAPTTLNLTLASGAQGQGATTYMTSKHPSQALGYSQLAYIFSSGLYLGYTPDLPNYSYELAGAFQFGGGIVDANPADCIGSLLTDTGFGVGFPSAFLPSGATGLGSTSLARLCWTANSFFISPVIEDQDACASIIGEWLEAGMVGAFFSEQLLKFVPYTDTTAVGNGATYSPTTTPVANLTDNNFLADGEDDPIKVERTAWEDAYNRAQVTFDNRANDYNPELIYEQDEQSIQRLAAAGFGNGERIEDPKQWDFITTLAAAQYAASMRVQRSVYIRNTYSFRLPTSFAYLEPMDVVTINDSNLGLNATPVRITKIEDDPVKGLDITAEDFLWGIAAPAYNPKSTNTPNPPDGPQADPGSISTPVIFEATSRVNQALAYQIWIGVAGQNPNWGGCHVYISRDNTNFVQVQDILGNQEINAPARMGVTTTALPYGTDPDTTDSVTVDLSESAGQLSSGTAADANNLATLFLIDTELMSYETATLVGSSTYQLGTLLRRGQLGTIPAAHAIGAQFLRIDDAVFKYQLDPIYLGQPLYFKFTSFNLYGNQEQSLADVTSYTFTPPGLQAPTWGTSPTAVITYSAKTDSGGGASIIDFQWSSFQIERQDGSIITIPISSSLAVAAAPTLSQVSGGSLAARTLYARIALIRNGEMYAISAESSLAVSANNLLHIASPTAVAGYDGWAPMLANGSSGAEDVIPLALFIPFGTSYTEPSTGAVGGGNFVFSGDPVGQFAIHIWNGATNLSAGTTYYFYPYYNTFTQLIEINYATAASPTLAAIQVANGNIPLSTGAIQITTPSGGGGSGGGSGGGGRNIY
jgi:hypothetical protein